MKRGQKVVAFGSGESQLSDPFEYPGIGEFGVKGDVSGHAKKIRVVVVGKRKAADPETTPKQERDAGDESERRKPDTGGTS
jgi:hypothetical protein